MPTEAEQAEQPEQPERTGLRDLLRGDPQGATSLDADAVIRRARARRRPKRIAAGALGGLAAALVVVPVVLGVGAAGPMSASDGAGSAAAPESAKDASVYADEDSTAGSRAEDPYPGCQLPGWDGEAVPSGVELRVATSADAGWLDLTLANGGTDALNGELAGAPIVALSSGEVPIGWSEAAVPTTRVDLEPGAQLVLRVPLAVVTCSGEPVGGVYGAEASLGIRLDDGAIVVANSARTEVTVAAAQ